MIEVGVQLMNGTSIQIGQYTEHDLEELANEMCMKDLDFITLRRKDKKVDMLVFVPKNRIEFIQICEEQEND